MSDESKRTPIDIRVGLAISEYLSKVDKRQPLDVEAWLSQYADIRPTLQMFINDQAEFQRVATLDSKSAQVAGALSTDELMSEPYLSTHKNSDQVSSIRPTEGARFGNYQLLNELGHGGMGQVYAARHQGLGRMVALKVMATGDRADATERKRFHREAEAVAKLDHPNIVRVYEVGRESGWDYFTMKLLPGGSLCDWMETSYAISYRKIAQVMVVIAEAIHHAHLRGILHRDLKPSNILLDDQQHPIVVDFGLAKQLSHEQTTVGQVLGTPAYMAPEQLYGETTTLSDVYGLGATLYSLLAKQPPFSARTLPEMAEKIRTANPPALKMFRADIPRDLEIICSKCLAKSPEQRYASAADLSTDLRRWLNGEPIHARPVSWTRHAWTWCRRHPMVSSLAATLLLVVVGATVALAVLLAEAQRLGSAAKVNADNAVRAAAEVTLQRDRARQVLDSMTSTLAYEWLAGQPALTNSQQVFLRATVEQYRELIAPPTDEAEPQELLWLAQVQHRLSGLVGRLGDREEALKLLEQASETLGRIPTASDSNELRLFRAKVAHEQQTWLADLGQFARAVEVLEAAIQNTRLVLDTDPENRQASQQLGQMLSDLGNNYRFLRRGSESLQLLQEAVAWNLKVFEREPASPSVARQLAISRSRLGLMQMQLRDYHGADDSLQSALTIQQGLAAAAPEQWRLQADVCYTLDNLGLVADRLADLSRAADYISSAVQMRRQLLQVLPGEETLHRAMMQSLLNFASIVKRQEDWERHRDVLGDAIQHASSSQTRFPDIKEYLYWEWVTLIGLAENHEHAKQFDEALALLDRAIPLIQSAPQDSASTRILNKQLLRAWNARAPILTRHARHADALADWQSCIDQTDGIEQAHHRLCQAIALFKAGAPDRAVVIADEVVPEIADASNHFLLPNIHYNLACLRTLMAGIEEDAGQQEALLQLATKSMSDSFSAGWTAIEWLQNDPDLHQLLEYPPFQIVLANWRASKSS